MMSLLETGVKFHVVTSRQVCDALLNSDHLRYDKSDFWVAALKMVRKIIGKNDYLKRPLSFDVLYWAKS